MASLKGNISKFFAWIMVSIVIISLAGFGIQDVILGSTGRNIATVGNEKISIDEFLRSVENEIINFSKENSVNLTIEQAKNYGIFNYHSEKLAQKFWPGPLTLLVNKSIGSQISSIATSNLQTVALRVPSHPVALKILKKYKKPIAAPSANLSGTVSATNASHVFDDFGDNIEMILDIKFILPKITVKSGVIPNFGKL